MSEQGRTEVPILGLLGLLFVGLKLTGHIDWSWWWVTAPFWGPFALAVGLMAAWLVILGLGALAVALYESRWRRS